MFFSLSAVREGAALNASLPAVSGKTAIRNHKEGRGRRHHSNPVRASTLPDCGGRAMKRTSLPLQRRKFIATLGGAAALILPKMHSHPGR
jgi:hypothetical protein